MSLVRKLKPDRNITGFLIPMSMLPIFGLASLIFNLHIGMLTVTGMVGLFALFYLYVFLRTRSFPQLVLSLYAGFLCYMFAVAAENVRVNRFEQVEYALAYFTGILFFVIVLVFLAVTRQLKWRGREIFELAAEPVEEIGDGYTSRPRPVGKVEYSPEQMRGFASFCARHLIALPYRTSKNITLVPVKMGDEYGRLLGLSGDYRDATWVNFDVDGEVSVHIAHKDYLDYREPLAFDALCASFGQVFVDFLELFDKGEDVRVIDRLNDLRIGIFS